MDEANKKVRVLEISHGLAPGGIESFLLNLFENIDKDKIKIDFAVACNGKQFYEDRILEQGSMVYHTSDLDGIKNMTKHFFRLISILRKEGPFDVVHSHIDFFNGINLMAAFIAGVPIRVSHSHNTNSANAITRDISFFTKIYRNSMKILISLFSTIKIGCSTNANEYMYGKNAVLNNKCSVILNGINLDKFRNVNNEIIDININKDNINFITIGRICEQKNSLFIVKIMKEITKLNSNVHLYWVGKGPQERQVEELINNNNLKDKVTLLGARKDVAQLLASMDFMLFPSKWEGLPVTLIEAQISNLPCFISDTITVEADLGLCNVIPLKDNEKIWAEKINNMILSNEYRRVIDKKKYEMFNIRNVCKQIEKIYTS